MTLVRVIAATICTVLLAATSVGAAAQTFGVGTMSQGTITYSAGSAIAKVVSQQARLKLRVQPYTGTTQIVPLVNAGELDFTLANVLEASNAASGAPCSRVERTPSFGSWRLFTVCLSASSRARIRRISACRTLPENGFRSATQDRR